MKRIALVFVAMIVAVGIAGCSGGGGDAYDFHGSWNLSWTVTSVTVPRDGYSAGSTGTNTIRMDQNGASLVLTMNGVSLSGKCDPGKGTFAFPPQTVEGKRFNYIKGQSTDKYNMHAFVEWIRREDGAVARENWDLALLGR